MKRPDTEKIKYMAIKHDREIQASKAIELCDYIVELERRNNNLKKTLSGLTGDDSFLL